MLHWYHISVSVWELVVIKKRGEGNLSLLLLSSTSTSVYTQKTRYVVTVTPISSNANCSKKWIIKTEATSIQALWCASGCFSLFHQYMYFT